MTNLTGSSRGASVSATAPRGAVHEFLRGLIDYAGLFPPAALELDPAIRNYARDVQSEDSWMLATFICPSGRLSDLAGYVPELFPDDGSPPLRVSALAVRASDAASFTPAWEETRSAIDEFESVSGGRGRVEAVEVAVPLELFENPRALSDWISTVGLWDEDASASTSGSHPDDRSGHPPGGRTIFFEPPLRESWRDDFTHLADALVAVRGSRDAGGAGHRAGFKLRCGGVVAAAFPSVEQVAHAIMATATRQVPFKATAGLHHPIRHHNDSVETKMHGFLNVFGASLLARARKLSEGEIIRLLSDENPRHFVLSEDCFCWKDHAATGREITNLRTDVVSYGSCSFDEPREDLRELGIL